MSHAIFSYLGIIVYPLCFQFENRKNSPKEHRSQLSKLNKVLGYIIYVGIALIFFKVKRIGT